MIDWHRIIFDESQSVKGKQSKVSLGASWLSSSYKWLVSGTPLTKSGHKDLSGQLRVLQAVPYDENTHFMRSIEKPFYTMTKAHAKKIDSSRTSSDPRGAVGPFLGFWS